MSKKVITLKAMLLAFVVALNCWPCSSLASDARKQPSPLREFGLDRRLPLHRGVISSKIENADLPFDKSPHHQASRIFTLEDEAELFLDVDTPSEEILSGSNVTYTITVTNEGTGAATAFNVTDELPSETTFVSCEATGGGVCGGSGNNRSVSFETLAPAAPATITLVATVNCLIADDSEISNTAEIHPLTPDPEADEVENETVFVTVRNPAPSITNATVNPSVLWPPNHQLVSVTVNYDVADNCGPVQTNLHVTSNEPVNGTGDGDTVPDWQIINAHVVRLRVERAGKGSGRVYTITITATDIAGRSASRDVTVMVPKSQKK
jgi:uncharacterized repeat protein (TIGR01451 family)